MKIRLFYLPYEFTAFYVHFIHKQFSIYYYIKGEQKITSHTLVAQKIADQSWLIANTAKMGTFFSNI